MSHTEHVARFVVNTHSNNNSYGSVKLCSYFSYVLSFRHTSRQACDVTPYNLTDDVKHKQRTRRLVALTT